MFFRRVLISMFSALRFWYSSKYLECLCASPRSCFGGILPRLGIQFPKPYFVLVPTIEQFLLRHGIECLLHFPVDPNALKPYPAEPKR
jgi:hypothetical protein